MGKSKSNADGPGSSRSASKSTEKREGERARALEISGTLRAHEELEENKASESLHCQSQN